MYTCMYLWVCMYVRLHIYAYTQIHIYVYMHQRINVFFLSFVSPMLGSEVIVKFNFIIFDSVLTDHLERSMALFLFLSTTTSPEKPVGTILIFTMPLFTDQSCTFVGQSLAA